LGATAQGIRDVTEVRLRWSGHRLQAEVNLAVSPKLSVAEGHAIAVEARHQLLHKLPYLSNVTIHIDPEDPPGKNIIASKSTPTKVWPFIRTDSHSALLLTIVLYSTLRSHLFVASGLLIRSCPSAFQREQTYAFAPASLVYG
jgi:hypothetical protein